MTTKWWTAKELLVVRAMVAEKATNREIADRLGKTISQVKAFCYHKGLRFRGPHHPQFPPEVISSLIEKGLTAKEISKELRVTYASMKHQLRRCGLRIPKTTRSRRCREVYQDCIKEWGINLAEVSHLGKRVEKTRIEAMKGLPTEKNRDRKRR